MVRVRRSGNERLNLLPEPPEVWKAGSRTCRPNAKCQKLIGL